MPLRWVVTPRGFAAALLLAIPPQLLALQAIASVRFGVDVPYWDDWRQYLLGEYGSFDLAYLMRPDAGTLYPVSKVLDSLAQLLIAGNTVVYQLLSMVVVLGLLMVLQWRLLRSGLGDRLVAATAFLLVLPMLRAGTYWGLISLTYFQGIPTVTLLASLWLVLVVRGNATLRRITLLAVGLVGGFAYISGAFSTLVSGLAFLLIARVAGGERRRGMTRDAVPLIIAGCIAVPVQLLTVFSSAPSVSYFSWPWTARFWAYLYGEIAGSLWLPPGQPSQGELSLLAVGTALACTLWATAILFSLRTLWRCRQYRREAPLPAIVLVTLTASIVTYLGLVAGARAGVYVDTGDDLGATFGDGLRFHHPFWVTLIWPWVGAILLTTGLAAARRVSCTDAQALRRVSMLSLPVALLFAASGMVTGSYDYGRWYSSLLPFKSSVLDCLASGLNSNSGLNCQTGAPQWDLSPAIVHAMAHGASFTRSLHIIPGVDAGSVLYDLGSSSDSSVSFSNADVVQWDGQGVNVSVRPGTAITIRPSSPESLGKCRLIEATVIVGSTGGAIQVSARAAGGGISTTPWQPVPAATDPRPITMSLVSETGFADAVVFRLAMSPQVVRLGDISMSCRITDG